MRLFLRMPGAFQYGRSPKSDLLNAGKPGRKGEHVGERKNIAAIEEGKNVPVLMVFFAHSFNDSLSMNELKKGCVMDLRQLLCQLICCSSPPSGSSGVTRGCLLLLVLQSPWRCLQKSCPWSLALWRTWRQRRWPGKQGRWGRHRSHIVSVGRTNTKKFYFQITCEVICCWQVKIPTPFSSSALTDFFLITAFLKLKGLLKVFNLIEGD